MCLEENRVIDENLEKVSGGAIWKPRCANCGKMVLGGVGIIRLRKKGSETPSFCCTECGERFLNNGEAIIDPGYEKLYQKYEKSKNEKTGKIIYGWRDIEQMKIEENRKKYFNSVNNI